MSFEAAISPGPVGQQYDFTRADFDAISVIARDEFGLSLSPSKLPLVQSRLTRRLRRLGIADFETYRALLGGPNGDEERLALVSTLTTNVTSFFRESHHFDALRTSILPDLIDVARSGRRVRIWSAGCSTGQEPYSIAMTLLDLCPEAGDLDIKILGTDIDPVVVKKGQMAEYGADELEGLSSEFGARFVHRRDAAIHGIKGEVRQLVSFGVLNLIDPLPFSGKFDVIFCRNVAIYFDRATQQKVWQVFLEKLTPQGHLLIGHSERISGPAAPYLKSVGQTTYQKSETADQTFADFNHRRSRYES